MPFEVVKVKDLKTELGNWVKTLRKQAGLSQEELATQLNLARPTIQKMEAGRNFTIETLLKVLYYFDQLERLNQFVKEQSRNTVPKSLY